MFRSLDMSLHQVMFARESMWDTMNYLAHNEQVMFTHGQTATQSRAANSLALYANKTVKRCEELFLGLDKVEAKARDFDLPLLGYTRPARDYVLEIDAFCMRT